MQTTTEARWADQHDPRTCVVRDVTLGRDVRFWGFVNLYGCTIGDETRIGTFVEVQKGARIGARCKVSSHTFICEGVTIEDDVFVGHGVMFINDKRPRAVAVDGRPQTEADWTCVPTHVGRGASIGTGATILCGVRIGAGAMIGAGAVVTKDVAPGAVVAGNPARPLPAPAPVTTTATTTAQVPQFDLRRQASALRADLMAAIEQVVLDGAYALGPAVEGFEREFAALCGARHCVGVNSGTSALHLALLALGVGEGDEVITTPATFVATAWAISYCGARPVLVDVEEDTLCLDPAAVERALTPRTKAVVAVHLYGHPADASALRAVCDARGVPLLEDAAQAHGASVRGRPAGALGRAACFSFYPSKNLGACGEGGAIVTDDDALAAATRELRDHAQRVKGRHERLGFNYRMEGIQGAALGVKVRHLPRWNQRRREVARAYLAGLAGTPGLRLPVERPEVVHAWHQFVVRHPRRDDLRAALAARGVGTAIHYPTPVHLQPAYAHLGQGPGSLPVAERAAGEVLSLPMFPELTHDEVERVIAAVKDACR
ncbi:MAG: DegT/DnrJ/EryC1/StrS family aminotransferase [Planctomycetes bacterium]|nr:DegT/DnrJ/EryC1/StrS family aminotransferase [Planctomycetota bacterium]